MDAVSLSAYAKRRGVSPKAVSKAVASGRLRDSVTRDEHGTPKISDPDLADREWTANTRPRVDRPPAEAMPLVRAGLVIPAGSAAVGDPPDYNASRAWREAHAARREAALADVAELEAAERKGELVPVKQARADVTGVFMVVRTRLLSIPAAVAQRMPHLASEVVPALDELLREALEELADDGTADLDE